MKLYLDLDNYDYQPERYKYAVEQMMLTLFPEERPEYPPREGRTLKGETNAARFTLRRSPVWTTVRAQVYRPQGMGQAAVRVGSGQLDRPPEQVYHTLQHALKMAFYQAGTALLGGEPPWGALTGVRPVKLPTRAMLAGATEAQACRELEREYHVSPRRARLAVECARASLAEDRQLEEGQVSLYAGGGALLEGAVLIPGQDARLAHELHPRLGPVRHGIPIREGSRRVPGLGQGEVGAVYIAGDHGSHLLPGHRAIGGKTAVSCAIHNSFPSGPGHIGTIPPACRHIGKPTLATLLLRAGHPAQDGDKHSPGQTAAGLEHCGAHPIHQVIFIDIAHRLVGPMALGNIGKGVLSRRQGRARQQGQHHAQRQGCGNHSSLHKPLSSLERYNDV